ncbi:MAG: hypothetical protein JWO74_3256 [Solirubrobacterales bacterium]|jgi:hypothetical protein|nr:hypothetical protein [Solirubrobacterales bacterium]
MDAARLEQLRAEARYRRERRDLYAARAYGGRPTSAARLRELEREATAAAERLAYAEAEARQQQP